MVLLDPEGAHAAKERPHGIAGGQSSAKSGIGTTFEQADPAGLDGRAELPARGPHLPPPPRLPQRDPHVPKRAPEAHPQSAVILGLRQFGAVQRRSRSVVSIYRVLRPRPFAEWFQEREESRDRAARVGEERERRQTQRQRQEHDRGQGPFSQLDGGIPDSGRIER